LLVLYFTLQGNNAILGAEMDTLFVKPIGYDRSFVILLDAVVDIGLNVPGIGFPDRLDTDLI